MSEASRPRAWFASSRNGPRTVDGIDLYVSPGEIYGFLGPNGAGKSVCEARKRLPDRQGAELLRP